jgi:hypothetical protein
MGNLNNILISQNLNISENPMGTDKGDFKSYIEGFYEDAFSKIQYQDVTLLEIGFRHGASLALWSDFFAFGKIYGVDNMSDLAILENAPRQDWLTKPNVTAITADAYAQEFVGSLNICFDVIIDDGPHSLASQVRAIELYLPILRPNGLMIIEDIQSPGGLTLFSFLPKIPLDFKVTLKDFRHNGKGDDDILLVIQKLPTRSFLSRLMVWGLAFLYIPIEIVNFAIKKSRKKRVNL